MQGKRRQRPEPQQWKTGRKVEGKDGDKSNFGTWIKVLKNMPSLTQQFHFEEKKMFNHMEIFDNT